MSVDLFDGIHGTKSGQLLTNLKPRANFDNAEKVERGGHL